MWRRRNAGAEAQTQTARRRTSHYRENTFFAKRIRCSMLAVTTRRMMRWWRRRNARAEAQTQTAADQPLPRKHLFCQTNSRSARAKSKEDAAVVAEERRSRSADPDRGTADQPYRENTFFAKRIRVQRAVNPSRMMYWWRRIPGAGAQAQTAGRRTSHCRENTFFAKRIQCSMLAVTTRRMMRSWRNSGRVTPALLR